jgi:protocatechuate 3,4-dioxygenase beta subunit
VAPTARQTEGPYFKPDSPLRASLVEPGMAGPRIVVTGLVLSTACQPIAKALIDVWHADDRGDYDASGYRLRGHQFTDAQGRYRLESIVPGIYQGRTRHFHVKIQAPNRPVLTTQLYFPGEAVNARDPIFSRDLVMQVSDAAAGKAATFDFVLDLSGARPGKG